MTLGAAFLAPFFVSLLTLWLPFNPAGSETFAGVGALAGLGLIVAILVGFPVLAIAMLFPVLRGIARLGLVLLLFAFAGWWLGARIGVQMAGREVAGFASRSDRLVAAIADFEQLHGAPPASLEELVPDFLDALPGTGFGAYPDYSWSPGAERPLRVEVGGSFDSSSSLVHDPGAGLPGGAPPYSGLPKRVGDWVWVQG